MDIVALFFLATKLQLSWQRYLNIVLYQNVINQNVLYCLQYNETLHLSSEWQNICRRLSVLMMIFLKGVLERKTVESPVVSTEEVPGGGGWLRGETTFFLSSLAGCSSLVSLRLSSTNEKPSHMSSIDDKLSYISSTNEKTSPVTLTNEKFSYMSLSKGKPSHMSSTNEKPFQMSITSEKPSHMSLTNETPYHIYSTNEKLPDMSSTNANLSRMSSTNQKLYHMS